MDSPCNGFQSNEPAVIDDNKQKITEEITRTLQEISKNVSEMQKLFSKMGKIQNHREFENNLSRLIHYTTDLCKMTSTKLKELAGLCTLVTSVDEKKWKLQLKRLSDEFMIVCNEFHTTQKIITEKKKDQITSSIGAEGESSVSELEHENNTDDEQIQLQEWQLKLQFIEEQEQDVQKLQEDISDINQLMREMSFLINEQSETVNNIEANIEETAICVVEGTEQLQQTAIHKSKSRRRKFNFAISISVILGFITGITIWQFL